MKKLNLLTLSASSLFLLGGLAGCGQQKEPAKPELTGTAAIVADASTLTEAELVEKSKAEMKEGEVFKVTGLSSVLKKVVYTFAEKYPHMHISASDATDAEKAKDNISVKTYKDSEFFPAIEAAKNNYFADYALTQDIRSTNASMKNGLLHNYVPKDYAELGLPKEDTAPLKTLYFNKAFYHHTAMPTEKFYNVWQVAGTAEDENHISDLSFQSPVNEKINMSYLLSLMNPANEARLTKAYKDFYGEDYKGTEKIGKKYVKEFINNVATWHTSDTKCLKEYLPKETDKHFVYFGAFAKMKDTPDVTKVDWNFECNGFKGFIYAMHGSVINNAKHPYTAALFARCMLLPDSFAAMCTNEKTPNSKGEPSIQYGYYSPCVNNTNIPVNDLDFKVSKWKEECLIEDETYLVEAARANEITEIKTLVAEANKATA